MIFTSLLNIDIERNLEKIKIELMRFNINLIVMQSHKSMFLDDRNFDTNVYYSCNSINKLSNSDESTIREHKCQETETENALHYRTAHIEYFEALRTHFALIKDNERIVNTENGNYYTFNIICLPVNKIKNWPNEKANLSVRSYIDSSGKETNDLMSAELEMKSFIIDFLL